MGLGDADSEAPDRHATDIRGVKPEIVDLGELNNKREILREVLLKFKTGLESEGRHDVTLLYDRYLGDIAEEEVLKMAREAKWDIFQSCDFTGSEADTVVYVGYGGLEPIGRAKLRLCIVLMWDTKKGRTKYERSLPGFQAAIRNGLVTEIDITN